MATLNAEYINPFLMAAKKILQDMCFVEVKIQKPTLREASFGPDMWVIMIGVTGEMDRVPDVYDRDYRDQRFFRQCAE